MKHDEVFLVIDVYDPSTLPMARLADYLKPFAVMLGSEAYVHFDRVVEGSAKCKAIIDPVASPKVTERVTAVAAGNGPKSAMRARDDIDHLLLHDNATGHVALNGRNLIQFPGRMRAVREEIGPVGRGSSIEGQIYSIGGKDDTINVHLIDGHDEIRCVVSVELARRLGPYLRGPRLRLFGQGAWSRIDGVWKLKQFQADDFTELNEIPLSGAIDGMRSFLGGIDPEKFSETMMELREG